MIASLPRIISVYAPKSDYEIPPNELVNGATK
jgi:hypothetical protein